jgi:putative colanic acid biosynthesis UDP-glucose lipid carrier transferase
MAKLPFKSDFVKVSRPLKSGSLLFLYSILAEVLVRRQVTRVDAYVFGLPREPLSTRKQLLKRVFDVVISGFGLVALCPVMLIAAAIIRLDSPGPILFRQARNGFEGKPFRILKFRTMSVIEDGEVVIQATLKDMRVTRVGSFLRRTSIDDMSLVGPRSHAQAHDNAYEKLIVNYAQRHKMKPGITGLSHRLSQNL